MADKFDKRAYRVFVPSVEDVRRAKQLAVDSCPRRYCWWWRSLAFEWEVPVEEGCQVLERAPQVQGWKNADVPCKRCVPDSPTDHCEPREPHLVEDGFDAHHFLGKKKFQQ